MCVYCMWGCGLVVEQGLQVVGLYVVKELVQEFQCMWGIVVFDFVVVQFVQVVCEVV